MFQEVSQFVALELCNVEQHPITVRDTGDHYCQSILHHDYVSIQQYDKILRHLNRQFSGVPGGGFNNWSQATGPLGVVIKAVGAGAC